MIEEHKKQLCELAEVKDYKVIYGCNKEKCPAELTECCNCGFAESNIIVTLEILIKAMWAINREWEKIKNPSFLTTIYVNKYSLSMGSNHIKVYTGGLTISYAIYNFADFNNSEQEALQAALEYILEQEKKNV